MKQKGVTLIEILVVSSIICILLTITIPRINDEVDKIDVDNIAKELVCDLRWMQQLAINSGGVGYPRFIILNQPAGYCIIVNGNVVKKVVCPRRVRVYGQIPVAFSFSLTGFPTSGLSIYLESGKESRSVIIDTVGRIRISK